MDDNERILKIEELKKLKEQVIKETLENNLEETTNSDDTNTKVKTIGVGTVTGGLNMYPAHEEQKSGMINVITLSILSFLFEVLFIVLSIIIFK